MRESLECGLQLPPHAMSTWTLDDDGRPYRRGARDEQSELRPAYSGERGAEIKRVLVVDDEHLIADTLARILNLSGFVAHAVYSGEAALEVLPSLCPDIVLTDVRMPGRNGIETGILVRAQCPQTRVVLFSGQAGVSDMMEQARSQGHGFELWPKPIHPKELVKRLREL